MPVGIGIEDLRKAQDRDNVQALVVNMAMVEIHRPMFCRRAKAREKAKEVMVVGKQSHNKHLPKTRTGWGRKAWHHYLLLHCHRNPVSETLLGHSLHRLSQRPMRLARKPTFRPRQIKLRKVLGVLKKNETELPPEVSEVVKDTKLTEGLSTIKNMHDAVENLGVAQQSFEKACFARAQNLASWRQFLHLSVQRWQEYTQHFLSQEKYNLEQIATAREAVQSAQAIFKNLQEKGVITIDAEEDPAMMEEEPMKTESSRRIQEGLEHMTTSLEQLANQADKEHAEEQQLKKRARKEPPDDTGTSLPTVAPSSASAALGSKAMEPFAQAHSG